MLSAKELASLLMSQGIPSGEGEKHRIRFCFHSGFYDAQRRSTMLFAYFSFTEQKDLSKLLIKAITTKMPCSHKWVSWDHGVSQPICKGTQRCSPPGRRLVASSKVVLHWKGCSQLESQYFHCLPICFYFLERNLFVVHPIPHLVSPLLHAIPKEMSSSL